MQQLQQIELYFPWFFPALFFLVGANIGSFLNVCIHRIPLEKSVVSPGSHCACGTPIAWFDNIPILSWFVLRGRARCCGHRFSFRYAAIEFLTAALFLLCWMLFPPAKAIGGMIFSSMMICVTFIDLDHMIIPDRFSIGGFVVGVGVAVLWPSLHGFSDGVYIVDSLRSLISALMGAFVGSSLVLWLALLAEMILRKEAMGFGDVKLMGAIGAFCGWQGAVFAMFGGAVIGTFGVFIYVPYRFLARKIGRRMDDPGADPVSDEGAEADSGAEGEGEREAALDDSFTVIGRHVPFGPMLSTAGILYFLYLHREVDAYFAEIAKILNEF